MDVLILNDGKLGDIKQKLIDEFKPNEIVNSAGTVYSFDYKELQIDIIPQPTRNWETAKCFFDWAESGNLMGKISHRFNLKYGFSGLVYAYRSQTGKHFGDIIVSKDLRKIFTFLEFDYDRYLKGFDTQKEIFDYIINNKYYNPKYFDMDNLYGRDRKRNKKRTSYQLFLKYAKAQNTGDGYDWKNKTEYIDYIDEYFPEANLKAKIAEFKERERIDNMIKEKFNGHLMMQWTNLGGKELGSIIGRYKSQYNDFRQYVLDTDIEQIEKDFKEFYRYNR